ncbi:MAG TPA: ATP-binding protein [Planctomycetota bacterium]|nr:ATP-binding protein [Planctomycetota bacterium]
MARRVEADPAKPTAAVAPRDDARRATVDADRDQLIDEIRRLRPLADLGRMAATVAHEVRNPLAGISANAELVREALSDQADIECVDIILGEVDRLGRLVTDLLFYSRERESASDRFDLRTLVRTTCELSSSAAEAAGVDLSCAGEGLALGDVELSRQALLNVVRNAIEACKPGARVVVTASPGRIEVADQGAGVPDKVRARLFEPFVTGRTRGLGLGAAVARRCLQRQRGDLHLVSTGPGGSVFALTWDVPSA